MTILDPITQAAIALQRRSSDGLAPSGASTIPESFGHRLVDGFVMWVSQATAPNAPPDVVAGQLIHQRTAPPIKDGATSATFAVALGYSVLPPEDRTASKVLRIYADGLLIYDVANPGVAPDFNGMKITFHPGNPDELPDATIAADMGALTPGFRNMIYLVIRDYPLQVGPTPVAPPPVTTAPFTVKSTQVYNFPGWGGTGFNAQGDYNAGLVNIGVGGLGQFRVHRPPNPAYPEGGHGGYYIDWINDSQSSTGRGGGYNSVTGKIQPYPVDIGNGMTVIAGSSGQSATLEVSSTTPGTVTQAPAPQPTYRTDLPKIQVELADAIQITPVVTTFELIDNNDVPGGGSNGAKDLGVFMNWNDGIFYGWTNHGSDSPPNFLLHAMSARDHLELQRFAPVNGYTIFPNSAFATQVDGASVNFDYLAAHDPINQLAFTSEFHGGIGNSDPIICISLKTGKILYGYGRPTGDVDDVDDVSVSLRGCGDCVVSTNAAGRAYGLVSGARLGPTIGLTQYQPTGVMTSGGHLDLPDPSEGILDFHGVLSVLAYPIVDRPDLVAKHDLNALAVQDWYCIATVGANVFLVHGSGAKILDAHSIYTARYSAIWSFIDPTDYNVVLVLDTGPKKYLCKLKFDTVLTPNGVTPVFQGAAYTTEIPQTGSSNMETSLRESHFNNGQMVYPGSVDGAAKWHTVDLNTGELISSVPAPTVGSQNVSTFIYDSNTGKAYTFGTGGVAAEVGLQSGLGAAIPLSNLLKWLTLQAGYTEEQIEVSGEVDDVVIGGLIDTQVGLWSLLTNLSTLYEFSYFESEGKIKFNKGTSGDASLAVYTIDLDSLSKNSASIGDANENLITTLAAPSELAGGVEVDYIDIDFGFQSNAQTFQRSRFPFKDFHLGTLATYASYIVMTGSEALQRAARVAFGNYAEGVVQSMNLPFQFARIEPGDAVNLIVNQKTYLVNIKEVVFNADWSLSVTGVDFNYKNGVSVNADTPIGLQPQSSGPSDSLPLFLDVPLPDAAADNPGQANALVFTGVESKGQPWWTGSTFNIMEGIDNPLWRQLYFTQKQVPYGFVADALPATDFPFQTLNDSIEVISQTMSGTGTTSISDANFWRGVNAAFVGDVGRWELIYFESMTWINARRVSISKILRGRRGTEVNCNNHDVSDYFIPFNRSVLQPYQISATKLNEVVAVSAVGSATTKPAEVLTGTLECNSLKPWAPVRVKAHLSGSDVVIEWLRRDRLAGSPLFVTDDVPMSEDVEQYDVEVYASGALIRSFLGLTAPTVTYTAAQQTTDGWTSPPNELTLRVFQISAAVGRGFTSEVNVNVE